jgi:glycine dehydrogenase subunit 1
MVIADMEYKHPWIPITRETQEAMLKTIGRKSIDDLFQNIPEKYRLKRELNLPDSHSELAVTRRIQALANKNKPGNDGRIFLGGGVSMHHIPAIVPALAGRSEFVTSYTSYQAEVSQGMLQALFEYQSLLAEILDIGVVNSSLYDMATALAEAARMAARVKRRRSRFLVPASINPEHFFVLQTYAEPAGIEIVRINYDDKSGLLSLSDLKDKLDDQVAGVYIENPSFLGFIETQVDEIEKVVHNSGALLVVGVDILSLGLMRPPGDYDADIVIAEGQPLGSPIQYGGPLLGILGCRAERNLIYQLPGRLVGMTRTVDKPYDRGFVLTLSPREQHIRREKATSNICTNQALAAVTAAIYASTLGSKGLHTISKTIAYNSNYAVKRLNEIPSVKAPGIGSWIWKEFVVSFGNGVSAQTVHEGLLERGFHGGMLIKREFPHLGESMLFCVTEIQDKKSIDQLVDAIQEIVSKEGAR